MAIAQPLATDPLNAPDHAALHRIIAADMAAPAMTIQVSAAGDTSIGDPALVNYSNNDSSGILALHGSARRRRNLNLGINELAAGGMAPHLTRLANTFGYGFDIGEDGYVRAFEIPYDWDDSTDLELYIHFYVDEAYALNSGEVRWQINYTACKEDATEAVDGVSASLDTGDINIPATAKYLTEGFITLPHAQFEAHDTVFMSLTRIALTGGNNPAARPIVVSLEIEYIKNSLGIAM